MSVLPFDSRWDLGVRRWWGKGLWILMVSIVFATGLLWTRGLRLPFYQDEKHYWEATRYFAERLPPTWSDLGGYAELTTPLSFLLWGGVEALTGAGVMGGRLLTLVFGLGTLALIGFPRRDENGVEATRPAFLATAGVLLFPYFVPLCLVLYTDMIAAFFVVAGLALYRRERHPWAAVCFALGIATRQYMVAFPCAVALHALKQGSSDRSGWARPWLWHAGAAATLGIWIAIFGGLVPAPALEPWPTPMIEVALIRWDHAAFFATIVGAYFVVPEFLLFRRRETLDELWTLRAALLGLLVVAAFAALPWAFAEKPLGIFNRTAGALLPVPWLQAGVYAVLAWLACVRFARLDLAFWILLASLAIWLKAQVAWEKYLLPVVCALWYLRAWWPHQIGATLCGAGRRSRLMS